MIFQSETIMLRNKSVTPTFLLAKDVSFMIRIINDTKLFFPTVGLVEPIIIRRLGLIRKLITKNLTDSIIAITWDGIKCDAVAD